MSVLINNNSPHLLKMFNSYLSTPYNIGWKTSLSKLPGITSPPLLPPIFGVNAFGIFIPPSALASTADIILNVSVQLFSVEATNWIS